MQIRDKHFIGGRWLAPSDKKMIEVHNAGTGEVMGRVPAGNATDADAARFGAEAREQDFRTRIRERSDRVVLRKPIALVSQLLRAAREPQGRRNGLRRALAADDGRLVEDGEAHRPMLMPVAPRRHPRFIGDSVNRRAARRPEPTGAGMEIRHG